MTKKTVIIGAGPGGLASAMLLAKAGMDVTVLERMTTPGGRTSTFTSPQGHRFDMGPTFFLYPAVLGEVFARCGLDMHEHIQLTRLDPQYKLVFEAGGQIQATGDVQRMTKAIAAICPDDARNFTRYMTENRRKFAAFKPILERHFDGWRDLLKLDPRVLGLLRPWHSVDQDLQRYFRDPRIRLAFTFQSKYLGMSPFQCPSLFTILSFLEYEYGVYHPTGGCGAVSQAMAEAATSLGAKILYDLPVTHLSFEGSKATAVHTAEETYPCDALVINADFAHAMSTLVPDRLRRRWTDRKLQRKAYSCSTFMMYLGMDRPYEELSHHTIFLSDDYARNLREIETDHVVSQRPSIYVHNPCITDPTMAPRGKSALYVLAPVTQMHPNVDWQKEAPAFRQTILKTMAKLGVGDIEKHIEYERLFTPADWQSQMHIYRGATFNLAHTFGQMLHFRPHNRFEDLQGVYLTGGGTHPGSGLPVIYQSALISSKLIAADLGLGDAWADADVPSVATPELALAGARP